MRNIVTVARVEPSMARRRQMELSSHECGKQNTTSAVWQRCVFVLVVSSVCRVRGSLA